MAAEETPMAPACNLYRARHVSFGVPVLLAIGVAFGTLILVAARALAQPPADVAGMTPASRAPAAASIATPAGLHRATKMAPSRSSDGWYLGMAGIALVLAVVGGFCALARRFLPLSGSGGVQIVGRVSLSPKHAVYLLRAGRRVLLVGTGPNGAPSLISELDEGPEIELSPRPGEDA
jgi:flagellar biogenesis protein FliO